jgi:thiol-disulfide isomerase/thioredoxin
MSKRLFVSIALIIILILVIVNQKNQETNYVLPTSKVNNGTIIQNTDLLLSSGKQTSLYLLHDKEYLLINIWASWCEPCIDEVPELIKLSKIPNLNILGLNVNDTQDAASIFITELEINYPVAIEKANVNEVINQFSWSGIPTSIIINKEKKIIVTIYGEIKEKKIVSYLNSLSNE